MDLKSIEAFIAICDTGSLSNAANILYISQPALTHRLNDLETELGVTLFFRSKGHRKTVLTPAGEEFLKRANKLLIEWKNTVRLINGVNSSASFNIGCSPSIAFGMGTQLFNIFFSRDLPINPVITAVGYVKVHEDIQLGKLNLGITARTFYFSNVNANCIAKEKMVLVCNDSYGEKDFLTLSELDKDAEIIMEWSGDYIPWRNNVIGKNSGTSVVSESILGTEVLLSKKNSWIFLPITVAKRIVKETNTRIMDTDFSPPDRCLYLVTSATSTNTYDKLFAKDILDSLSAIDGITML